MIKIFSKCRLAFAVLAFIALGVFGPVQAQIAGEQKAVSKTFEIKPRAADAVTLVSGSTKVRLWGIQIAEGMPAVFNLKLRTALDNAISGHVIQCDLKARTNADIYAQCVNASDLDLALFMVQQGYVSVDRGVVYGTVFEEVYIQAETEAQGRGLGIWAEQSGGSSGSSLSGNLMMSFGFVLFICIIVAFAVLSIVIMRGFQKVIDAQNENVEMMGRERALRDKERRIVASMLDTEIKANKAKIEAYLVVYDEMLKGLRDPDRALKYKQAGDIVQKQPALERSVFDRNTDKLDILGIKLSSDVIHFYARIKSNPDYSNLEPDMELKDAVELIEDVLKGAKHLDKLADGLIDDFRDSGILPRD